MSQGRLFDKVAIVTGGAQGIGRACAMEMAKEGCKVVIADMNETKAEEVVRLVKTEGKDALAVMTDVSRVDRTLNMARATADRFGKIDILMNCAALVSHGTIKRGPFDEIDVAEWDRVIDVNLKGVFLSCRAVFPYMRTQGAGKIINMTSTQFFDPRTKYLHYIASKGGVIGLTRALAMELGEHNIHVNCIAPGGIVTEHASMDVEKALQRSADRRPINRLQYPADVVGTVIFLASRESDFITGQTLMVNGGAYMH